MKGIIQTAVATLLLLVGATSTADTYDIPEAIVKWSQDNAYEVLVGGGSGSGFFTNSETFVTACHVVSRRGEDPVFVVNMRDTNVVEMDVQSCNEKTDVAILKRKDAWWNDTVEVSQTNWDFDLKLGKAVWGAGYPLGMPLIITSGHAQHVEEDGTNWIVTAPTIMGDSGSPLLSYIDGKVYVIGIRVAIRAASFQWKPLLIPHIVYVVPSSDIIHEIHGVKDVS